MSNMAKKLLALRMEPALKAFFQEYAQKEQRSFTSFMIQAAIHRVKQVWGVDWEDVRLDYIKKTEGDD